jgi:hypothetical protein
MELHDILAVDEGAFFLLLVVGIVPPKRFAEKVLSKSARVSMDWDVVGRGIGLY